MVTGRENGGAGRGAGPKTAAEQMRGFAQWWRGAGWKGRSALLVPLAIIVIVVLVVLVSRFFTEYLWYQEVGFTNVFWTRIWARIAVMAGAGVVFFGIFYGNLRLAWHLVPKVRPARVVEGEVYDLVDTPPRGSKRLLLAVAIVLAIIFAIGYGGSWTRIWLFFQQSAFGFTAPVFDRDAGFFVFTLPFAEMILTFVMVALIFGFIGALVIYIANGAFVVEGRSLRAAPHVKAHLSVILAVAMLAKAADYLLGVWELAYSERGAAFGPAYTDVNVQIPVLRFLAIVAVIAAVLFLVNIYFKGWSLPAMAIGLLFVTWLFAGQIYPAIVQQYRVSPTEIEKESPYIANNIEADALGVRPERCGSGLVPGQHRPRSGLPAGERWHHRQRAPVGSQHGPARLSPDPGDPHLLLLQRRRHRSLCGRRPLPAVAHSPSRVRSLQAHRSGADLGQRAPHLHSRLRDRRQPGE